MGIVAGMSQVWREGAGTQDGKREVQKSAEGEASKNLTLGGDRGSGSRPQQGDRVWDTGGVCKLYDASLDSGVGKEECDGRVYLQLRGSRHCRAP